MIDLPNKYKFSILYDDKEYELQHDPKGWDENSIGFTRSSDFGNNIEYVVPLKYAFDGRQLLKMLWERDGVYAKAKLRIYKRDNEYTFNHFYQYLFDFTTYQDDLNYVTMNGIEDSFYSKFQTFASTEYAVPLPELSNKLFLNFTGTSVVRENRLQFSYGEPIKGWLPPNNFPLRGTRAVRSFVRELAFTDGEGLPYESLTIRAVENVTFDLKVNMDIQTKEWIITLLPPPNPRLKIWKHKANGDLISEVKIYEPTTSKLSFWTSNLVGLFPYKEVKNTFVYEETLNISLNAGELLSFCYVSNFANSSIRVLDALNSDLRIGFLSASNYQNLKLEVFPFSYLLRALVEEIDSEAILEYDDRVEPYLNMLTCTDAIINAFGVSENKIHCSLRKALDALNVLECIYIDFTGNKMRIGLRKDAYLEEQIGEEIEVSNIVIKQQTDHIFSRIVVGWESDERVNGNQENTEENGLTYPFCEKKTFEIKKALKENEYNIVSPFIGDCYTIEAYFRQVLNDIENRKDKKIISLACIYELADVAQNLPTFELEVEERESNLVKKRCKFGLLYSNDVATDPNLVKPTDGWRLPNESDVDDLHTFTTRSVDSYTDGGKLKNTSAEFWDEPNANAENLFGFDVRGGGFFDNGSFFFLKGESDFWVNNPSFLKFAYSLVGSYLGTLTIPDSLFSIRFCRDASFPELSYPDGTRVADYVDGDNNRYVCRKIYNRVWMCENLMTLSYHDGTPISTNKARAYDDDYTNAWIENTMGCSDGFEVGEFEVFLENASIGFILSGEAIFNSLPSNSDIVDFAINFYKEDEPSVCYNLQSLPITNTGSTGLFVGNIDEEGVGTFYVIGNVKKGKYKIIVKAVWNTEELLEWGCILGGIFTTQQNDELFLYRKHEKPIDNFLGDSDTVYNVPYTPKRIINNHLPYLSISLYKTQENATFVNSLTGVNISSRCDFEDAVFTFTIVEQIDDVTIKVQEDVSLLRVGYRLDVWRLQPVYDLNYKVAYIDIANKIIRFFYPVANIGGTGNEIKIKEWIVEHFGFSAIDPIFLPSTIELSTAERLNSLTQLQDDRYGFFKFRHEKTGKTYQGWINTITFAVGKNETQNWELQAKNI